MTITETTALKSMAEHLTAFADTIGSHPPSIVLQPDYCDGETAIEIDDGIGIFPAETVDGRRWMVTELVVHPAGWDEPSITEYVERGDFPTLIGAVLCALHLWVDGRLEAEIIEAVERTYVEPETEDAP